MANDLYFVCCLKTIILVFIAVKISNLVELKSRKSDEKNIWI